MSDVRPPRCREEVHFLATFDDDLLSKLVYAHAPSAYSGRRRRITLDLWRFRESGALTVGRWLDRCHDYDALGLEVAR